MELVRTNASVMDAERAVLGIEQKQRHCEAESKQLKALADRKQQQLDTLCTSLNALVLECGKLGKEVELRTARVGKGRDSVSRKTALVNTMSEKVVQTQQIVEQGECFLEKQRAAIWQREDKLSSLSSSLGALRLGIQKQHVIRQTLEQSTARLSSALSESGNSHVMPTVPSSIVEIHGDEGASGKSGKKSNVNTTASRKDKVYHAECQAAEAKASAKMAEFGFMETQALLNEARQELDIAQKRLVDLRSSLSSGQVVDTQLGRLLNTMYTFIENERCKKLEALIKSCASKARADIAKSDTQRGQFQAKTLHRLAIRRGEAEKRVLALEADCKELQNKLIAQEKMVQGAGTLEVSQKYEFSPDSESTNSAAPIHPRANRDLVNSESTITQQASFRRVQPKVTQSSHDGTTAALSKESIIVKSSTGPGTSNSCDSDDINLGASKNGLLKASQEECGACQLSSSSSSQQSSPGHPSLVKGDYLNGGGDSIMPHTEIGLENVSSNDDCRKLDFKTEQRTRYGLRKRASGPKNGASGFSIRRKNAQQKETCSLKRNKSRNKQGNAPRRPKAGISRSATSPRPKRSTSLIDASALQVATEKQREHLPKTRKSRSGARTTSSVFRRETTRLGQKSCNNWSSDEDSKVGSSESCVVKSANKLRSIGSTNSTTSTDSGPGASPESPTNGSGLDLFDEDFELAC